MESIDSVINVIDYGAIGDGTTLNTLAFQAALDQIRDARGGKLIVPPGIYITGTLIIHSNTILEILPGAVILGSKDLNDYPIINPIGKTGRLPFVNDDLTDRHLVLIHKAENIFITGGGTIDGQGDHFWFPQEKPKTWIRPKVGLRPSPLIEIIECRNVKLDSISLKNSPGWTISLVNSQKINIHNLEIQNNFWGPNTDGIDICGCKDVRISDCSIECGDDAICVKTMPYTQEAERITVTNCVLTSNCVGLKLGCFESYKDMRQIVFSNCVVYGATRAMGIYNFRGALYEDISISNIVCDTKNEWVLNRPIHIDFRAWEQNEHDPQGNKKIGKLQNVIIDNVIASTNGRIIITAADDYEIENVLLSNIQLKYYSIDDPTINGSSAKSTQFSCHSKEAQIARAAVVVDNVNTLQLHNIMIQWPKENEQNLVPMSAAWFRTCKNVQINAPFAQANAPSIPRFQSTESSIHVIS